MTHKVRTPPLLAVDTLLTRDQAIAFLNRCLVYSMIRLKHNKHLDFVPITHVEGRGDRYALGHIIGDLIQSHEKSCKYAAGLAAKLDAAGLAAKLDAEVQS